jgi:hypothetical protein
MSHWSETLMKVRPTTGRLDVTTEYFTDAEALRSFLEQESFDGWWCLASEIHEGSTADLPAGPLLSGEGISGDGSSLHLRRSGNGWRIDRFRWQDDAAGPHRAVTEDRARIGGGYWRYRVVWSREESRPWQPWVAPLMNFEREAQR